MGWPEITYIIITAIGLTVQLIKHGEPCGKYNFGLSLFTTTIIYILLYYGGFFN